MTEFEILAAFVGYVVGVFGCSRPGGECPVGETGPKLYRAKPVEIEAVQWDGSAESADMIDEWGGKHITAWLIGGELELKIYTLEGRMTASPGDYIIKGTLGEFYPCKPDIFEGKYEEILNG